MRTRRVAFITGGGVWSGVCHSGRMGWIDSSQIRVGFDIGKSMRDGRPRDDRNRQTGSIVPGRGVALGESRTKGNFETLTPEHGAAQLEPNAQLTDHITARRPIDGEHNNEGAGTDGIKAGGRAKHI